MVTPLLYWVVVLRRGSLWALGDLNHASDRVISAAELWHAKKAPKIIVSGGSTQGPISEASRMADLLKRLGVPASAISLEEKSLNTEGNAREVAALTNAGSQHILLVTSSAQCDARQRTLRRTVFASRRHPPIIVCRVIPMQFPAGCRRSSISMLPLQLSTNGWAIGWPSS